MDLQLLIWIDKVFHGAVWFNYIMVALNWVGVYGVVCILTGVILLFFKRTRWAGVAVLLALLFGYLSTDILLKPLIARQPVWEEYGGFNDFYSSYPLHLSAQYSFPAGKAAAMFGTAVALILYFRSKAVPAVVLAFLVALSDLYLCLQYPTDVMCGTIIGAIVGGAAYVVTLVLHRLADRMKYKKEGK